MDQYEALRRGSQRLFQSVNIVYWRAFRWRGEEPHTEFAIVTEIVRDSKIVDVTGDFERLTPLHSHSGADQSLFRALLDRHYEASSLAGVWIARRSGPDPETWNDRVTTLLQEATGRSDIRAEQVREYQHTRSPELRIAEARDVFVRVLKWRDDSTYISTAFYAESILDGRIVDSTEALRRLLDLPAFAEDRPTLFGTLLHRGTSGSSWLAGLGDTYHQGFCGIGAWSHAPRTGSGKLTARLETLLQQSTGRSDLRVHEVADTLGKSLSARNNWAAGSPFAP